MLKLGACPAGVAASMRRFHMRRALSGEELVGATRIELVTLRCQRPRKLNFRATVVEYQCFMRSYAADACRTRSNLLPQRSHRSGSSVSVRITPEPAAVSRRNTQPQLGRECGRCARCWRLPRKELGAASPLSDLRTFRCVGRAGQRRRCLLECTRKEKCRFAFRVCCVVIRGVCANKGVTQTSIRFDARHIDIACLKPNAFGP